MEEGEGGDEITRFLPAWSDRTRGLELIDARVDGSALDRRKRFIKGPRWLVEIQIG